MAVLVLVFILVIGPLAVLYGRDSRIDREAERRRFASSL